jgi:nitrite reductase (NO-forming)
MKLRLTGALVAAMATSCQPTPTNTDIVSYARVPMPPPAPTPPALPGSDARSVPGYGVFASTWKGGGPGPAVAPGTGVAKPATDDPLAGGKKVFTGLCAACHQATGLGLPGAFPPLAKSDFLMADKRRSIGIVLHGLNGPVTVNGATFTNVMPPQAQLSDADVASVLTYVRSSFGNSGEPVTPTEVAEVRAHLDN